MPIGRLKPACGGAGSPSCARSSKTTAIARRLTGRSLGCLDGGIGAGPGGIAGPVTGFVAMLGALTALVLLIACTNVAGMLLARGLERQHELATRLAVGASRFTLICQLLLEGVALALVAGAVSVPLTYVLVGLLTAIPAVAWDPGRARSAGQCASPRDRLPALVHRGGDVLAAARSPDVESGRRSRAAQHKCHIRSPALVGATPGSGDRAGRGRPAAARISRPVPQIASGGGQRERRLPRRTRSTRCRSTPRSPATPRPGRPFAPSKP